MSSWIRVFILVSITASVVVGCAKQEAASPDDRTTSAPPASAVESAPPAAEKSSPAPSSGEVPVPAGSAASGAGAIGQQMHPSRAAPLPDWRNGPDPTSVGGAQVLKSRLTPSQSGTDVERWARCGYAICNGAILGQAPIKAAKRLHGHEHRIRLL